MNEWLFKFEKYQREILGPSSFDSVATLGKKFGNYFSRFVCFFFFEKASKKVEFWPKRDKFYQNFGLSFVKVFCIWTKANNAI